MNKYLSKHTAVFGRIQFPIEMRDKKNAQGLDKLLVHGQDDLQLLVFAATA
jgi:hypothetical protein